eukprot:3033997-Pleurochrysis_carterae.AAC.1
MSKAERRWTARGPAMDGAGAHDSELARAFGVERGAQWRARLTFEERGGGSRERAARAATTSTARD